jgi:para-aminobenzoate synthetase / 4-amino-4-deoxychorismate lyase
MPSPGEHAHVDDDVVGARWARFDNLREGTARRFQASDEVLVATRHDQVAGVLSAVDQATRAGRFAFGYLAYEAAPGLDSTLVVHPGAADGPPLAWFARTGPPVSVPVVDRPQLGQARGSTGTSGYTVRWRRGWTPAEHRRGVDHIRQRIGAGDCFQCNYTVRLHGQFRGDTHALYTDLAAGQRGADNAYLDLGRFVIASASPELFFLRAGDDVLVRPMKGTAPRGRTPAEDRQAAADLRASVKERAENVIIVDLMRNDLGRIAEPGTVAVTRLCTVERYETVLQMTSDVGARLRPGTGLLEVFRALFPCGSVTGAPKASTMRIITEVETSPRGVYCGAIGWVAPSSEPVRARFNVAIRTAVIDRQLGAVVYGTGGGITWASRAAAEHAELLLKTRILSNRSPDVPPVQPRSSARGRRIARCPRSGLLRNLFRSWRDQNEH